MVKQDPRVSKLALSLKERFFHAIYSNNNDEVARLIASEPSLIYIRAEGGGTFIHLLFSEDAACLKTLEVALKAASDAELEPDVRLEDDEGMSVMDIMKVMAEAYHGDPYYDALSALLGPICARSCDDVANAARAETDAYFARSETIEGQKATKHAEKKAAKGDDKCIVSCLFDQELDNNPYYNLDEQKIMAQYNAQLTDYLELPNFDFSPKAYLSTISSSDDLSILMVPSALESFSIEQITGFITQLSAYLFDNTDA